MALRVLSPGPMTTIQDLGRFGYERYGVPQSGAMDWFALRAANALVGNAPAASGPEAAGLEFVLSAPTLQAGEDCLVAAAGRGYALLVQGRRVGLWRAALVRRGEVLSFVEQDTGGWGYLAVLGGLAVPVVMGSRSTYLRGGFGGWQGRVLREEDVLPVGSSMPVGSSTPVSVQTPRGWKERAGRWLPVDKRPNYAEAAHMNAAHTAAARIAVVEGPQEEAFTSEAREAFYQATYTVSATSDRMGYRLDGPRLEHSGSAELISEPMTWGAVQVPANGLPMVMMSDRPTSGGYAKIATVARAALPLLAQAMPGSGRVQFYRVSVEEAQRAYRQMMAWIDTGIEGDEDGISS